MPNKSGILHPDGIAITVLGLLPSVCFVSTNLLTRGLMDVPGGASDLIDITITHFADPPIFYRFRWPSLYLATFSFLGDSGGLTTISPIYGRGERI